MIYFLEIHRALGLAGQAKRREREKENGSLHWLGVTLSAGRTRGSKCTLGWIYSICEWACKVMKTVIEVTGLWLLRSASYCTQTARVIPTSPRSNMNYITNVMPRFSLTKVKHRETFGLMLSLLSRIPSQFRRYITLWKKKFNLKLQT